MKFKDDRLANAAVFLVAALHIAERAEGDATDRLAIGLGHLLIGIGNLAIWLGELIVPF